MIDKWNPCNFGSTLIVYNVAKDEIACEKCGFCVQIPKMSKVLSRHEGIRQAVQRWNKRNKKEKP